MAEHVRIRKTGTRDGRPVMLDDGHIVEGDELGPPTPGMPYLVRRTVIEEDNAPEVFNTSPVRAVITDRGGVITLLTDNSRYSLEILGRLGAGEGVDGVGVLRTMGGVSGQRRESAAHRRCHAGA
jgi:hypothetical protein